MKFSLRFFSVLVAFFTVLTLIKSLFSEYISSNPTIEDILAALNVNREDARNHYLLGLHYYNNDKINAGIDRAISSYIRSLKRNPLDSYAWLALARAYRDKGLDANAEHAAKRAAYLSRSNPYILWESGMFLLEYNASDAAVLLRRYIYLLPEEQMNIYPFFHTIGLKSQFILKNLIPGGYAFYKGYLNYLTDNTLLSESADVWEAMKALNYQKEDHLAYCNFLIANGKLTEAMKVWGEFPNRVGSAAYGRQKDNFVWNSDFELPPENGGFDWRIGHAEGVKVFIDREVRLMGNASLRARFDGKSNPDVYIAKQIVPVEGRKLYRFRAAIKTVDLTTTNGIFIEVLGYQCPNIAEKTEPLTGTNSWKEIAAEFVTPKDCIALWLGFRREKSVKFDNRISGDVWIDSVSLTRISEGKVRR